MFSNQLIGFVAAAIGFCGCIPYFHGIYLGRTKPHVFTWFIWSLLTGIACAAQIDQHAGPGAWATGLSSLIALIIAACSLKTGEKEIARSDWIAFIAALLAIPLWFLLKSPLWSVILISLIDAAAFFPTFRKSWNKPSEEVLFNYACSALSMAFSITAIENKNFITVCYPVGLTVMNTAFIMMVLFRRKMLRS